MKRNLASKAVSIFIVFELVGFLSGLIYSLIFVTNTAPLLTQVAYYLIYMVRGILFGMIAFGAVLFISAIIYVLVGCVYILIS